MNLSTILNPSAYEKQRESSSEDIEQQEDDEEEEEEEDDHEENEEDNIEDSEDTPPVSLPPSGRITRSFVRSLSGDQPRPSLMSLSESDYDSPPPSNISRKRKRKKYSPGKPKRSKRSKIERRCNPCATCIPVEKLPILIEKVLKSLSPEQRTKIDIYELQNLSIECALDINRFGQNASLNTVCQAMVERILDDAKELSDSNKHIIRKAKAVTYWHDQKFVATIVERYKEQMTSEEMESKRSYLNDRYAWTAEDIQKFNEAYKIYGDGPKANKLIAEYIGNGVHPNHVRYFKTNWKKNLKQKQRTTKPQPDEKLEPAVVEPDDS